MTTITESPIDIARKRLESAQAALALAQNEASLANQELMKAESAVKRQKHLIHYKGFVLVWNRPHLDDGYWFESEDGRLVRADHSADEMHGTTRGPLFTDDGPLYVDTTGKATKHIRYGRGEEYYTIPVTKKDGARYSCILGTHSATWLFSRYPNMKP